MAKPGRLKLFLHPGQQEVFGNPARFKVLVSSRRFGKSRLLLTTLIERAINYNGHYDKASPPVVLLVMPSLKQAKQIHWEPLVNILDGHPAVKRIFKSECRVVFKGNKPDIILRGANEDNGDNMRGLKVYFAGLDEMQDIKPIVWTEVLRPALVDTKNSTSLIIGCVNPSTKVLTPTGIKEIKDFDSDTKEKEYLPISEDIYGIGREFHKADGFFNNGIVETRKITTNYGFTLESSLNHPILTKDGWKKTGELEVGDKVAIDYGMEVWGGIDPLADFKGIKAEINGLNITGGMTEQLARFLGWGIAQWDFSNAFSNSEDFGEFFSLLKHLGMSKFYPYNVEIPAWLWAGKREWAVSFIKGYIAGAGLEENYKRIALRSTSKEFLKGMQLLLTNLGIVACLGKGGLVLNGFNPCEPLKNQDYYWDTIKTLEQSECQTFDFTIPETHSFWSNGFISHNTPKGAGTFFHQLYLQGGVVPNWASFSKTIYDNPLIPRDEIQRTKESLPEKIFRQEFLASWESFDGQIFSDLDKRHLLNDDDLPSRFDQVYLGVDWGDVNPALVVVGRRGAAYFVIDCWENPNSKAAIEQRIHNEKAIELVREHGVNRGYADPSQPGRILTMRRAGVPKLMEGYNRVSEGNGVVNTLLHQDKLFIAKSCKRVFDDMTAYHRESKDGNITDRVADGQRDHFCFVAGTKVLSSGGIWVNIEELKAGDYVQTSEGLNRVKSVGSRLAMTITVRDLVSQSEVSCTPDHPFYSTTGMVQARFLDVHRELVTTPTDLKPVLKNIGLPYFDLVYNIEVEEVHNYYVRFSDVGVLVHNCDALRYVLATLEHRNIENIIDSVGANILIPNVPPDDRLYGDYNSGY